MGTKNNPSNFDCYANAAPDEPMFVLLARDKHAAALVWLWAVMRELDEERAETVQEARECAEKMIEWAVANNRPICGLSVPLLAGLLELIRGANYAYTKDNPPVNEPTDIYLIRRFLAFTKFEGDAEPLGDAVATALEKS